MDFYSMLLAKNLSGSGGGDVDPNSTFKLFASDNFKNLTAEMLDGVTNIGNYAFYRRESLTSVTISNSVTNIGTYAFYNCDRLTSVTIPNSVTNIGAYAFYNCDRLTSVTISNGVTNIGNSAFANCERLTSVTIPNSVTNIGAYAFRSIFLKRITVLRTSPPSLGGSGVFYNDNFDIAIYVPAESVNAYRNAAFWSNYKNYIFAIST